MERCSLVASGAASECLLLPVLPPEDLPLLQHAGFGYWGFRAATAAAATSVMGPIALPAGPNMQTGIVLVRSVAASLTLLHQR